MMTGGREAHEGGILDQHSLPNLASVALSSRLLSLLEAQFQDSHGNTNSTGNIGGRGRTPSAS